MTEQESSNTNHEKGLSFWGMGCACMGMIIGLVIAIVIIVLVGVSGGLLLLGALFTAPPLEFIDALSDSSGSIEQWIVVVAGIVLLGATAVGGWLGYITGKTIETSRQCKSENKR